MQPWLLAEDRETSLEAMVGDADGIILEAALRWRHATVRRCKRQLRHTESGGISTPFTHRIIAVLLHQQPYILNPEVCHLCLEGGVLYACDGADKKCPMRVHSHCAAAAHGAVPGEELLGGSAWHLGLLGISRVALGRRGKTRRKHENKIWSVEERSKRSGKSKERRKTEGKKGGGSHSEAKLREY